MWPSGEIVRIHENYVTKTMFTLTEWLALWETSKEELNARLKCSYTAAVLTRLLLHVLKKSSPIKSIGVAIHHFFLTPPHNKAFSIISDQANKLLDHL